uniref:Uncharacterized protein n=1 Tax=Rangifer tarandus platyrhynchus TaxID=3082113 RepID=A0ACB0ESY9_RANTA|nr:unnamed protein product [Rangifer tarandus platyrhynchus]
MGAQRRNLRPPRRARSPDATQTLSPRRVARALQVSRDTRCAPEAGSRDGQPPIAPTSRLLSASLRARSASPRASPAAAPVDSVPSRNALSPWVN